ncbi:MAG: hypothetical protein IKU19_04375, partial [Clostridia bacterium]|nr:hypothetical protein [Clostridia bacterium]
MKIENKNINIPEITVKEVVSLLSNLYVNAITNGVPFKSLFTPFLWGSPGVGKSDGVQQLAANIGKQTGKTVNVINVNLLLFTPPDLHGFPVLTGDNEYCEWKMPELFKMDPSDSHINIIFLDELSAASPDVQKIAYQICYEHRIGEHLFPDNCIVIAAGNRTT